MIKMNSLNLNQRESTAFRIKKRKAKQTKKKRKPTQSKTKEKKNRFGNINQTEGQKQKLWRFC